MGQPIFEPATGALDFFSRARLNSRISHGETSLE
jgi:hypothetical protein